MTMLSRGIEISIARGVGEMVRGLSPRPFCFFSFFSFFFISCVHCYGTRTRMQR